MIFDIHIKMVSVALLKKPYIKEKSSTIDWHIISPHRFCGQQASESIKTFQLAADCHQMKGKQTFK